MSESNSQEKIQSFIDYWSKTEAAERANYQLFLSQLCEILDVPKPEGTKADDRENEYVFERSVAFQNPDGTSTTKFIDLYKRDSFVLEAKQGSERDAEKGRRGDAEKKKLKKGTAVRSTTGWQEADYIVGNPPFIGTWRMRQELGDDYAEAIRKVYKDVPDSADFVMYWWEKAACLLREGKIKRFDFITTNSLRQTFNRRVIEFHLSNSPIKKTKNTEQKIVGARLVPARNQEPNSTLIETKNQNLISKQRAGTSPAPTWF